VGTPAREGIYAAQVCFFFSCHGFHGSTRIVFCFAKKGFPRRALITTNEEIATSQLWKKYLKSEQSVGCILHIDKRLFKPFTVHISAL
jgi:hypothetical protein